MNDSLAIQKAEELGGKVKQSSPFTWAFFENNYDAGILRQWLLQNEYETGNIFHDKEHGNGHGISWREKEEICG